jgi:hypothetical protein
MPQMQKTKNSKTKKTLLEMPAKRKKTNTRKQEEKKMNWNEISELQDIHIRNMLKKLTPQQKKNLAKIIRISLYINNMIVGFLVISIMFYGLAQLSGYEFHITGTNHCCLPCDTLNRLNNTTNSAMLPLFNEISTDHASQKQDQEANNKRV